MTGLTLTVEMTGEDAAVVAWSCTECDAHGELHQPLDRRPQWARTVVEFDQDRRMAAIDFCAKDPSTGDPYVFKRASVHECSAGRHADIAPGMRYAEPLDMTVVA